MAALEAARAEAIRRGGLLLVAGSHYLLASARDLLERPAAVPEPRKWGLTPRRRGFSLPS